MKTITIFLKSGDSIRIHNVSYILFYQDTTLKVVEDTKQGSIHHTYLIKDIATFDVE